MIEIRNLSVSFGEQTVLKDYSADFSGLTVLMGPSGCGKTTLLRCAMGLQKYKGVIRGVGPAAAVFQENRLCPQLTAADNICLAGCPRDTALRELECLGLTGPDLTKPARSLSGGQQRRTALLRALLCPTAETLFLDEPFTGLDGELVGAAAAAVVRLTGERDCLLVTHDEEAARLLGASIVRFA